MRSTSAAKKFCDRDQDKSLAFCGHVVDLRQGFDASSVYTDLASYGGWKLSLSMKRGASLVFVNVILVHVAWAASYDPLVVDPNFHPKIRNLTVHDTARNRDIPIRIYCPPNDKPVPVVLFSHVRRVSR